MNEALMQALGDGVTLLFTALRVTAVYVGLLLLLRLAGKRTLGQMTPFDLLTLLLLSNAVQNAMIGPDNSLTGGLLAAALLASAQPCDSKQPPAPAPRGPPHPSYPERPDTPRGPAARGGSARGARDGFTRARGQPNRTGGLGCTGD